MNAIVTIRSEKVLLEPLVSMGGGVRKRNLNVFVDLIPKYGGTGPSEIKEKWSSGGREGWICRGENGKEEKGNRKVRIFLYFMHKASTLHVKYLT